MHPMTPKIVALLIGALVGLVCVAGLFGGIRILFHLRTAEAEGKEIPSGRKAFLIALAIGLLIGQFVLAGAILYFAPGAKDHPVMMALGLVSVNILIPLAAYPFVK
jgi:hypothetical protein